MSEQEHRRDTQERPETLRHLEDAIVSLYEASGDGLSPCEARDVQRAIASTSRVIDSIEYNHRNR